MNLNELFRTHKGTRSFDDLERACDKALTSQRLQQIATTVPKEFPKAVNVKAIARALGVTELVVVLSAAESLGLDVKRELPRLYQALPAAASDLDDDQMAAIAHVIRAFKREEVVGNAKHPAPTTEPAAARLRAVAAGGSTNEEATEADRMAAEEAAKQQDAIREMESKKLDSRENPNGET